MVAQKGVPVSIYRDRHGTPKRDDDWRTLEGEVRGEQEPTQVGRALRTLAKERGQNP